MRKAFRIIAFFLFIYLNNHAQTWTWAKSAGVYDWNIAYDIVTDKAGYSYVTGGFYDTAYFNTNMLTGTGWTIYLAKYSPNGKCVWAKSAGGTGEDYGTGVCFDNFGGLYLCGVFTDSVFFPTDTFATTSGIFDAFIARYDTAGNYIWSKQCGEISNDEWANGVGSDQWGNAYFTGSFSGSTTFGSPTSTLSAIGAADMFLAKFSLAGNTVWVKQAGGSFASGASSYGDIATDKNGNSFITGGFGGTVAWGTNTLTSSVVDAYVTRYDSSGNCLWVRKGGGSAADGGNGICMDKQKNCYITGPFRTTAAFGTNLVASLGGADIFIAKYDSTGTNLWVIGGGDGGNDYGNGVSCDSLGNVYATGQFNTAVKFGTVTVNGAGSNDVYVAKFFPNGTLDWLFASGGINSDRGVKLSHDFYNNCYVTGDYWSVPALFDTITLPGSSSGLPQIFVGKIVEGVSTGVKSFSNAISFDVFPNPSNGLLYISVPSTEIKSISIQNALGQTVYSGNFSAGQKLITLDLSEYVPGMYFVEFQSPDTRMVKKIVLTR